MADIQANEGVLSGVVHTTDRSDFASQGPQRRLGLIHAMMSTLHEVDLKLESARHAVKGAEEAAVDALYRQDNKELARIASRQEELFAEVRSGLDALKQEVVQQASSLDTLSGHEKAALLQAIKASAQKLLLKEDEVRILPTDEVRIQPIPSSGNGVGVNPPLNEWLLLRRQQIQEMLQGLLAMIEKLEEGGTPSTGYPIGLLFTQLSVMAIEQRELEVEALAERQRIINDVTSKFNQVLHILRRIQNNADKGEGIKEPMAGELAKELQEAMIALFGRAEDEKQPVNIKRGWYFDEEGNFIPGEFSILMQFRIALGEDYASNPVYQQITNFAKDLNGGNNGIGAPPARAPNNGDTSMPDGQRPTENLLVAMTENLGQLTQWVKMMGFNYANNSGRNYVGNNNDSTSAIQTAGTGYAQQTTTKMQQEMADITTFSDIAKEMIKASADLGAFINQASK